MKGKCKDTSTLGITLVALVVTVVVLLILAGITIVYVLGDNGVFGQASKAKIQTELGKIEERAQAIYSDRLIEIASNTLITKVETSDVIEQLRNEGYIIEQRAVSIDGIKGISLDKENITMEKNSTTEIKVTYLGVDEPFVYYVEVQGKYYQLHSNKGFITINREASGLTKADFEAEGGTIATLTVTSSDETVATAKMKEGSNQTIEIVAKDIAAEKEVTITVIYGSYKKLCKVKVVVPVLATDINLNETEYVITGGMSWKHDLQLEATLEPSNVTEKEVNWESSNPEIATVDSTGLVKAGTKGGDVTITATTKDKTNLSATCKITTELFGKTNVAKTSYTDSDGNTAQIPDGYAVGTSDNVNKVTGGLVAQDDEGNQFVWVPVGEVKKSNVTAFTVTLGRYAFVKDQAIPATPVASAEAKIVDNYNSSFFHQELTKGKGNTVAKALDSFVSNANTDGGYWLGRYEASNDSGTKLKYNKVAWTDITQPVAATNARNMKSSGTYQSDLVNSYAWDTAIVFIEKSGHTGYASQTSKNKSKLNTGKSGDKVCNIYDMASNCYEWTTETSTNSEYPCTGRGGSYDNIDNYTSNRSSFTTSSFYNTISFRCLLYRP